MNPVKSLFHSRKFLLLLADTIISSLIASLTLFFAPEVVDKALIFIGLWQPVIIALIVGIAVEDAAEKGSMVVVKELYEPNTQPVYSFDPDDEEE